MCAKQPPLWQRCLGEGWRVFCWRNGSQVWVFCGLAGCGGSKVFHDFFGELGGERVGGFWARLVVEAEGLDLKVAFFNLSGEVFVAGAKSAAL